MKLISLGGKLGVGRFAIVDDEDFALLGKWKWYLDKNGYVRRDYRCNGVKVAMYMHRMVMGNPKGMVVDHRKHDPLDNRKHNLRICSHVDNIRNSKLSKNNTSGFTGVSWSNRKKIWRSSIMFNRKCIVIGHFKEKTQAAKAYDEKAKELFGEFAKLNFPKNESILRSA